MRPLTLEALPRPRSLSLPADCRAWHRQRLEDAERLAALRARAQASLADPRPSLTEAEADARLAALFASAGADDAAV